MKPKCVCVYYDEKDGKTIKIPEKCTKRDLMKGINQLLVRGLDSDYVTGADTEIAIWARDKWGDLEMFTIEDEVVHEILAGNDKLRKEIRKQYREFVEDKKIEGIHILDAYMECCYGTAEICDFEDILGNE